MGQARLGLARLSRITPLRVSPGLLQRSLTSCQGCAGLLDSQRLAGAPTLRGLVKVHEQWGIDRTSNNQHISCHSHSSFTDQVTSSKLFTNPAPKKAKFKLFHPSSSWLLLAPPGFSWPWLLLTPPGSSWLPLAPPAWLLQVPPGSAWK
jgi:hypothetical protein